MRLPFRRKAVFVNLSRPRLGLSDNEVASAQRPRTGQVMALGAVGLPASFKCDAQGDSPGRLNPQEHPGGAQ
jgi:hypothetical protein